MQCARSTPAARAASATRSPRAPAGSTEHHAAPTPMRASATDTLSSAPPTARSSTVAPLERSAPSGTQ
eukprot:1532096-Prymnesium_polylepis.1